MKESETLNLINGQFTDEEAQDLIMHVFYKKITFHEQQDFSAIERSGKGHTHARTIIMELKQEMARAQEIIATAKAKNQKLTISSEIKISLSEV